MPVLLRGIDGIRAYAGFHLGKSAWIEIGQPMIDAFATATDDHDALSVDAEEAARGPYGVPVAQSTLILAMISPMLHDIFLLEDVGLVRQCGIDRLKFFAPVPVDSSIRLDATLKCARREAGAMKFTLECAIESDCADFSVLRAEVTYLAWPKAFAGVEGGVLRADG